MRPPWLAVVEADDLEQTVGSHPGHGAVTRGVDDAHQAVVGDRGVPGDGAGRRVESGESGVTADLVGEDDDEVVPSPQVRDRVPAVPPPGEMSPCRVECDGVAVLREDDESGDDEWWQLLAARLR